MSTALQPFVNPPEQQSPTLPSDLLRLVASDGHELDQMIELRLCQGWMLLSRSYSLERGHRAKLMRVGLEQTT